MEKITNLKDLLIEQLIILYSSENQQREVLLKMKNSAVSEDLKLAINDHIDETDVHIQRLENISDQLKINWSQVQSNGIQGIIDEGEAMVDSCVDSPIKDATIITVIQYLEHFEIAGYGSACTYANELELDEIADQLHLTLSEEKNIDMRLTDIAKEQINKKASEILSF